MAENPYLANIIAAREKTLSWRTSYSDFPNLFQNVPALAPVNEVPANILEDPFIATPPPVFTACELPDVPIDPPVFQFNIPTARLARAVIGQRSLSTGDPKLPFGAHFTEDIVILQPGTATNLIPDEYDDFQPFSTALNPFNLNGESGDIGVFAGEFIPATGSAVARTDWRLIAVIEQKARVFFKLSENRPNGYGAEFSVTATSWRGNGAGPGTFKVRDEHNVAINAKTGDAGYAEWDAGLQKWVVVSCEHQATRIRGLTRNSSGSVTVTGVIGYNGYLPADPDGSGFSTSNPANFPHPGNNKPVWVELNPTNGVYEIYQMACPD